MYVLDPVCIIILSIHTCYVGIVCQPFFHNANRCCKRDLKLEGYVDIQTLCKILDLKQLKESRNMMMMTMVVMVMVVVVVVAVVMVRSLLESEVSMT